MVEEFGQLLRLCSGLRLLLWHGVDDDGAVRGDFFRFLSQFVVVSCFVGCVICVRYLCGGGGGVRFGALCTNASSSYMMWQCSAFYFKKNVCNSVCSKF
jgi:hypothetical protein